jgi:hypothetical protein
VNGDICRYATPAQIERHLARIEEQQRFDRQSLIES